MRVRSPASTRRRLENLHQAGAIPDPKAAQIERLKKTNAALKERLDRHEAELAELKAFKQLALSRITAQHLEIERLREQATADTKVTTLPRRVTSAIGSCS
ncbi:hypothetical protein [Streptomyces sp. NPDC048269]|uniref:hypothetical protein n=1 Tax=Streptomyces sp. NPDC048269 TaxID=3155753 RepID=UPI00341B0241